MVTPTQSVPSITTRWSDEDRCFLATSSQFPNNPTHGETEIEAAFELGVLTSALLECLVEPAPAVTLDGRTAFSLWMEDRLDRSEWKYLPESGQQWWNRFAERLTAVRQNK